MSEAISLALIIAVPALLAPLLMAWLTHRNARKDREHDWERQDKVAERAAEASRKILASQAATTAAQEEATQAAHLARKETYSQLTAIHTLVNSNYTIALTSELNSTRRELIALKEIMALRAATGRPINSDAEMTIETAERRVRELTAELTERDKTDILVKAQIKEGQAEGKMIDAVTAAAKPAAEEAARKIVPPVVTEEVPPVVEAAVKEALKKGM